MHIIGQFSVCHIQVRLYLILYRAPVPILVDLFLRTLYLLCIPGSHAQVRPTNEVRPAAVQGGHSVRNRRQPPKIQQLTVDTSRILHQVRHISHPGKATDHHI